MNETLITTPFQRAGDMAMKYSWLNWENGRYFASLDKSLYARFAYLADLVASVVLLPLALINMPLGIGQALFRWDVEATHLQFSTRLLEAKVERLFASLLGAFVSPGCAYYFQNRKITPMVFGVVTTGIASYMIINNHPGQFDWSLGLGK